MAAMQAARGRVKVMARTTRESRKPRADELRRFAEVYRQTGDSVLAYLAVRPNGRRDVAEKRGPRFVEMPEVQTILAELKRKADMPEGLADDQRLMRHALTLADNAELSPRERLAAIQTYSKLQRAHSGGQETGRGFSEELQAFLTDCGIRISA